MRTLSAELSAAQAAPNAKWTVTARFKRAGTGGADWLQWVTGGDDAPGETWQRLWDFNNAPYTVTGQPWRCRSAACWAAQSGYMLQALRSDQAAIVGVRRAVLTTSAAGLQQPVGVAVIDNPYAAEVVSRPAIARSGSTVRVVWADGEQLYWAQSTDDGVTWGARQLLYNGAGSYVRYANLSLAVGVAGNWALVYSAWTAAGGVRLRGAHEVGGGWVNWAAHTTTVEWEVAGIQALTASACTVYLHGRNVTWSSLAVGVVTLSGGAFAAWWSGQPGVVDRAGLVGEIEYDGVTVGSGAGAYWLVLREGLPDSNRYWCMAQLFSGVGSTLIDEPVLLTTTAANTFAEEETHFDMLATTGAVFLVGVGCIWQLRNPYAGALFGTGLVVDEYEYNQRVGEGGRVKVRCSYGTAGGLPPSVGDLFELARTATGTQDDGLVTGTDRRLFKVVRVVNRQVGLSERRFDVEAIDGCGVLQNHRLRRQHVLRANDRTVKQDVEAVAAWSGVRVEWHGIGAIELGEVSRGYVCRAQYGNWTALQEYLRSWQYGLRAGRLDAVDGTGGLGSLSVGVVALDVALYDGDPVVNFLYRAELPGVNYEGVDHPLDWYETIAEAEGLLSVAIGMNQDGSLKEVWAAQLTEGYNSVRPRVEVRVGRAWSQDRAAALVVGELTREQAAKAVYRLGCSAHVGLELWDLVAVEDDERRRVKALKERWAKGKLSMEIELG